MARYRNARGRYAQRPDPAAQIRRSQPNATAQIRDTNRGSKTLENMALAQAGSGMWDVLETLIETTTKIELTMEQRHKIYLSMVQKLFHQIVSMTITFGLYRTTAAMIDIPFVGPLIASFVSSAGGYVVSKGLEGFSGMFS